MSVIFLSLSPCFVLLSHIFPLFYCSDSFVFSFDLNDLCLFCLQKEFIVYVNKNDTVAELTIRRELVGIISHPEHSFTLLVDEDTLFPGKYEDIFYTNDRPFTGMLD